VRTTIKLVGIISGITSFDRQTKAAYLAAVQAKLPGKRFCKPGVLRGRLQAAFRMCAGQRSHSLLSSTFAFACRHDHNHRRSDARAERLAGGHHQHLP
jgi:hypothetical protein